MDRLFMKGSAACFLDYGKPPITKTVVAIVARCLSTARGMIYHCSKQTAARTAGAIVEDAASAVCHCERETKPEADGKLESIAWHSESVR